MALYNPIPQVPQPAPQKPRRRWLPIVITGALTAVLAGSCGAILGTTASASGSTDPQPTPTKTVTAPSEPQPTQTATVPGPTKTVTVPGPTKTVTVPGPTKTVTAAAPRSKPKPAGIGDGMRKVGTDVQPGRYTTKVPEGPYCYWERLRGSGGELDDIIANDNREPGTRAYVTIRTSDKFFNSEDCGTWTRA
jgi:hypothetical protein